VATKVSGFDLTVEKYGFRDPEKYTFKSEKGLNENVIRELSGIKGEPEWMLEFRLKSFEIYKRKPVPTWGGDLSKLDDQDIYYYIRPDEKKSTDWDDVPDYIRDTFDKLGIPEAEQKFLAGAGAQYESEAVYHNLHKKWEDMGVIFLDTDTGLQEYPELFRQYFGTVVPSSDNKYAALNGAVWSGGSFVYVPEGVQVDIPLQAYFRINAQNMGQFERTLIIVERGAKVHYIEGCTAPVYSTNSLHSGVIEIIVKEHATCRYTTIQNWAHNIYNLVTQRSFVYEGASMEWVDGNLGSQLTMKYPSVFMMGPKAKGEVLSIALAGKGQHQDTGAKMVHMAPETTGTITSKSISHSGGRATYRGLARVNKGAKNSVVSVICDALILDDKSRSDTIPYIEVNEEQVTLAHEATVGRIGEEQLFYLMSRGLNESDAISMVVQGFMEPFTKELPLEYAVEMNRLIQLEMEGSVG
jgi:Fe-S cluster assembly protein SufB